MNHLHDPHVIRSVDLRVLGKLFSQRRDRAFQVLTLAGVFLLNVRIHSNRFNLQKKVLGNFTLVVVCIKWLKYHCLASVTERTKRRFPDNPHDMIWTQFVLWSTCSILEKGDPRQISQHDSFKQAANLTVKFKIDRKAWDTANI